MKRKCISWLAMLILTLILVAVSSIKTEHVSAHEKTAVVYTNATPHTNPYVGEDPYASGCSQNSYVVKNSNVYDEYGNVLATVQMWYSISCVTNWSVIHWSSGSAIGTQVDVWEYSTPINRACYPNDCSTGSWYAGGLSPSWTAMVDGHNITCSFGAVLKMGVVYAGASGVCG